MPSPVADAELARIETDLGVKLPTDYTALATRYNLASLEFNFSRFYPPIVRPTGLLDTFNALLNAGHYPFAAEYRRWGVVPVGDGAWQNELVLTIRHPTAPQKEGQPREITHPLALTRPYGTVWGLYPDEMHPTLHCTFGFIGSSFAQVLHMCLLCWRQFADRREGREVARDDELREGLATIDFASRGALYWDHWAEWAVKA